MSDLLKWAKWCHDNNVKAEVQRALYRAHDALESADQRIAELESALQRIREGAPTIGEDVSFAIAKAALKGQDDA